MQKVVTDAYLEAMVIAQAYALGGLNPPIPLIGDKIGLFNNSPALSRSSVLADLTPTIFSGYSPQSITWDTAPIIDPEGFWALRGVTSAPFQATGPITADLVRGLFIENSGATTLYMAEYFDQPINITRPGQIIQVTLLFRPNGDFGIDSVIGP